MSLPVIIGIAGGSGSGKTTVVNQLSQRISKEKSAIISQDNYYHSIELQQKDNKGQINFDLPGSIDTRKMVEDLEILKKGGAIKQAEYTFNNPRKTAAFIEINSAPILLVEGLFIFHFPDIKKLFDLKIFVHAEEKTRLKRRLQRDLVERGYDHETVSYQWINHAEPAFNKYLNPYKKEVDLLIDNTRALETALEEIMHELLARNLIV